MRRDAFPGDDRGSSGLPSSDAGFVRRVTVKTFVRQGYDRRVHDVVPGIDGYFVAPAFGRRRRDAEGWKHYRSLFDGQVLLERDPVIMKVANTWLILNVGGAQPRTSRRSRLRRRRPDRTSAFLNIRVADIQ
jgi:hypothetical protein